MPFVCNGADEVQRRVSLRGVLESADVTADGGLGWGRPTLSGRGSDNSHWGGLINEGLAEGLGMSRQAVYQRDKSIRDRDGGGSVDFH